jgi:hypothetical protein
VRLAALLDRASIAARDARAASSASAAASSSTTIVGSPS